MNINRATTTTVMSVIGQQGTSSPLVVVGPYIPSKLAQGFSLQRTAVSVTGVDSIMSNTSLNQSSDRTYSSSVMSHYTIVQPTCSQIPIMQTSADVCPLRIESVCGSYTEPNTPNEDTEQSDLGRTNDHSYFKVLTEGSKDCVLKQSDGVCDPLDTPLNDRPDLDAVLEELVLLSEAAVKSDTLLQDNPQDETLDTSTHQEYVNEESLPLEAPEKNDSATDDITSSACIDHSYQLGSKKRMITVVPQTSLNSSLQGTVETSQGNKMGKKCFLEVEIENEELRGITMREIRSRKGELRKAKARYGRTKSRFEQQKSKLRCLESLLFSEKTVERNGTNVIEISLSPLAMELYENTVLPSTEDAAVCSTDTHSSRSTEDIENKCSI